MHPRNPYDGPLDFVKLGEAYEPLKMHLKLDPSSGRASIDFKDEEAQRRLTEAIMLRDFDIRLNIPENRLCPPVPNRMNYVLWIQDIVHAHQTQQSRHIRGIDIGTGANVIYPFIACKLEPTWEFFATELDDESYASACKNVASNSLQDRIHVRKASQDGLILFVLDEVSGNFEFTMCNPPFYGSAEEIAQSAEQKELPPNAACTGADIEMIYSDGGEAGFVCKMVAESEKFQTRCKWYTSMLGKMSSVPTVVKCFRERSISNYAITEFVQGQTRRWAVAWSYIDNHLPDSIARIPSIPNKHVLYPYMPPKNTLIQTFPGATTAQLHDTFQHVLEPMAGVSAVRAPSTENGDMPHFLVEAQENTWSRSARRNHKRRGQPPRDAVEPVVDTAPADSNSPGLTCSCRVYDGAASDGQPTAAGVEFQWVYGKDRRLFEGFVGHVSRKIVAALRI
ncbi:hypothetical protein CPC08DRAFT_495149 [Agrocybe pediades]|nr:hypothetical protein CPC08DRAFT_495149 [Agrocybe pediades]